MRERYITSDPHVKAMTTDSRIPATMASARVELIYSPMLVKEMPSSEVMITAETANAAPNRQKMSATVVEVGSPRVLYMSSRIILASITDR